MLAGLFTALLPTLAPSLRWNEGLLKVIEIEAPEGIVCNASFPAPVSSATISATWVVTNVAVQALSRLAATSPLTSMNATAVTKGSMSAFVINGHNRDGSPYGNFLLDSTAGGGGAYADHDGLTGSGDFCVPRPTITNVESHEASGPILFLYRGILADTGGPGRHRGGATAGLALTPHETDHLQGMIIGHGVEVPNSVGLFGGMEGSCNRNTKLHSDGCSPVGRIASADDLEAWEGQVDTFDAKPGFFDIDAGDVIAYSFQGGGGFGDPLERDPAGVAEDVGAGYVGADAARDIYGVVLTGDQPDPDATRARRVMLREQRVPGAQECPDHPVPADARWLTPEVYQCGDEVRTRAGALLGGPADWVTGAIRRVVDPASHGPHLKLHDELELREYLCPATGRLLWSAVARKGEADLLPVELS